MNNDRINSLNELKSFLNKIHENKNIFIKDIYSTDEYQIISDIRIDEDGDLIIENGINSYLEHEKEELK